MAGVVTGTEIDMEFHHIHAYVDSMRSVEEYKALEVQMNEMSAAFVGECKGDVAKGTAKWEAISGEKVAAEFKSTGLDLVEQLICGVGFRVTGHCTANGTSSVVVTSEDPRGAKFIVTTASAESPTKKAKGAEELHHFSSKNIDRYHKSCLSVAGGRPGIGVLAFESSKVGEIHANYKAKHPKLVHSFHEYGEGTSSFQILEVFAYYHGDGSGNADPSTLLRFVQRGESVRDVVLPGMEAVAATYPVDGAVAYSDHWVSNVVDRQQFLDTLFDTLGFTSKVDFNAGVVAAGEAMIESTVTGNTPGVKFSSADEIMVNQSQIYLPINNALSEVGHVHLFLKELGQGIQHIASRVVDLTSFIQRTNDYRKMTGKGFTFLKIPRSYYGYLTERDLLAAKVPAEVVKNVMAQLLAAKLVSNTGIVELEITDEQIRAVDMGCSGETLDAVVRVVKAARFNNMYRMLGDAFDEETYLRIVRNCILVDIQANDVLFQIFTSNILQREAGDESPFLEFIQRVCSQQKGPDGKPKPIRPGCGGFGIRNFLTLFLSIEVSKAMRDMENAEAEKDMVKMAHYSKVVATFTEQLDLSNPILTKISDAMTAEADAQIAGDTKEAAVQNAIKEKSQTELQALSDKYKSLMRELRSQA